MTARIRIEDLLKMNQKEGIALLTESLKTMTREDKQELLMEGLLAFQDLAEKLEKDLRNGAEAANTYDELMKRVGARDSSS